MRGFKAFDKNLCCRGLQYRVGGTMEMEDEPVICIKGFHFCRTISDTYKYYPMSEDTRICEVEALGDVVTEDEKKYCTNKIKIISEITDKTVKHCNADGSIIGYCNTGDRNTGDRNTGDCNTGNRNTGDWNTGDRNTGCFCTKEQTVKFFDKDSDWTFDNWLYSIERKILNSKPSIDIEWINSSDMTEEEKNEHPEHETTGGFLKVSDNTKDSQDWWNNLSDNYKSAVMNLPNFDRKIFKKCTGIDVYDTRQ